MFGSRRAFKGCNFVHNDEIWKDHVRIELRTARKWPHIWGPLVEQYRQANCSVSQETPTQLQHGVKLPPLQLTSSYSTRIRETERCLSKARHSRYPQTTAGQVGWNREGDGSGQRIPLELSRHAKGRVCIEKLLRQPELSILHRVIN